MVLELRSGFFLPLMFTHLLDWFWRHPVNLQWIFLFIQHICRRGKFWLSWCTSGEDCRGWHSHALCSQSRTDGCSSGLFPFLILKISLLSIAKERRKKLYIEIYVADLNSQFSLFDGNICIGGGHCSSSKKSMLQSRTIGRNWLILPFQSGIFFSILG